MKEIAEKYLTVLYSAFEYDMSVYSQSWIYWWLLIPAFFYTAFFFLKWAVLTAPLWIPLRMVFGNLFRIVFPQQKSSTKKSKEDDI